MLSRIFDSDSAVTPPSHAGGKKLANISARPPALIDAVKAAVPGATAETFTPPAIAFDTENATGTVTFAGSGREVANSGLPLLEQAEDAGLSPDHGCRMGICNTCSCRKTAGAVRNVLTGETSAAADELIRICVSVPVGDVALDL